MTVWRSRRRLRRTRQQGGAVAVEFGLMLPLLIALVFAILDFGFWFNESLNVRHGVREAARQAIVQRFDHPGCTTSLTDQQKLVCRTKAEIRPTTGTAYVSVKAPAGWKRGERLLLCGMVKTEALSGITPLPADGFVKSAVSMSIEKDATLLATPWVSNWPYGDADPSGANWSWCS